MDRDLESNKEHDIVLPCLMAAKKIEMYMQLTQLNVCDEQCSNLAAHENAGLQLLSGGRDTDMIDVLILEHVFWSMSKGKRERVGSIYILCELQCVAHIDSSWQEHLSKLRHI